MTSRPSSRKCLLGEPPAVCTQSISPSVNTDCRKVDTIRQGTRDCWRLIVGSVTPRTDAFPAGGCVHLVGAALVHPCDDPRRIDLHDRTNVATGASRRIGLGPVAKHAVGGVTADRGARAPAGPGGFGVNAFRCSGKADRLPVGRCGSKVGIPAVWVADRRGWLGGSQWW